MKKSKKIKYYYLRYLLRPSRALKLSFSYLYGRFILFLALKGIKVPGLNKIKNKLPQTALDIFERQVLIYEIKGARFSFRKGPLWLRKTFEKIIFVFHRNKFWFLIVLKTMVAVVVITIPIGLFIVLRGMLPVPERVPYVNITNPLPIKSSLRTDWPYTEAPFTKLQESSCKICESTNVRGVTITPVLEPGAPIGLFHFGVGYYPSKMNLMRGFLASESTDLRVNQQKKIILETKIGNKLRIQYYLFPSRDSNEHQCKIELKDENNNLLASTTQTTFDKNALSEETGLTKSWHELFTPDVLPVSSKINEFIIPLNSIPKTIIAKVTELMPEASSKAKNISDGHDFSNSDCIYALGDFSIERKVENPPKRRGIIFILVDTLRADTAYDQNLMPNLNQFAVERGVRFFEHRAQGNMTVPSVSALMTSRFAREIGPIAFTYAADTNLRKSFYATQTPLLPTIMQKLGYRVGGIGWLSLFSEAMEGGVDLGFHNAIVSENSAYEARQITEQIGSWLENYGDAPFFLYVHYNTMHGPYKPPFTDINLSKLLAKPFGLNQRKQLYNALGHYWDKEFVKIIQKLKDLGIYDDVDIFITADHGAQFYAQPWDNLSGVDQGINGGYADKGHSLLDEEVRVPLIVHIANSSQLNGSVISTPTAHVDLLPTIYDLAGGTKPDSRWRGIDFYTALVDQNKVTFADLLRKRDTIYFDAHRYAGILYWGNEFKNSPRKYIRQFDPDNVKLYLTHNPWNLDIHWYQPEMFTTVDFLNHTENWVSSVPGKELENLRKIYFNQTPSDKVLRIIPKYSGEFAASLELKKNQGMQAKIDLQPSEIKVTKEENRKTVTFHFVGNVKKDEALWINLGSTKLKKVEFDKSITPLICQNGNITSSDVIANLFEKKVCPFFAPPDGIIDENYLAAEKPVVVQKSLTSEQVQQLEGKGAGEALQKALREWGYAK